MKVNKKKLAEIFNVDPRTIERWQSQGLPCVSGGGKGVESVFDTAMAIQWYAQREADIENEKLRKEVEVTGRRPRGFSLFMKIFRDPCPVSLQVNYMKNKKRGLL